MTKREPKYFNEVQAFADKINSIWRKKGYDPEAKAVRDPDAGYIVASNMLNGVPTKMVAA